MEEKLIFSRNNSLSCQFNEESNKKITTNIVVNDINIKVIESDDSVLIDGNLNGVNPNDLRVDYKNGDIIMHITQRYTQESQGAGFMAFMSTSRSFIKSFYVGEVDVRNLKYNFTEEGELTIYLPKLKIVEGNYMEVE